MAKNKNYVKCRFRSHGRDEVTKIKSGESCDLGVSYGENEFILSVDVFDGRTQIIVYDPENDEVALEIKLDLKQSKIYSVCLEEFTGPVGTEGQLASKGFGHDQWIKDTQIEELK